MGTAFGGGATDALFGAGSGNALTMITKYAAGIFLVLSLTLSILNAQKVKSGIGKKLKETPTATTPATLPPPAAKAAAPAPAPALDAPALLTTTATNVPVATKK